MLDQAVRVLHFKRSADSFVYCGRTTTITEEAVMTSMAASCRDCGPNIRLTTKMHKLRDAPVTAEEKLEYRTLLGKQQWVTPNCRLDFGCEVNNHAQKIERATVG